MLMRILPIVGGLLMSRGSRRVAGRHAGKLTLALGAWELWRAYKASQASKAPNAAPNGSQARGKGRAQPQPAPTPVRKKKRWI